MKARYFNWPLLALLFFTVTTNAGSPVWEISRGKQRLFIGGTIHLLSQTDYPLPAALQQAYEKSSELVPETDLQKMQSPEFQQRMLKVLLYEGDNDLKQVLQPATYKALEAHLASRGVPVDSLIKFKPGMVAMTLTLIELKRLGLAETGVDHAFYSMAVAEGKRLGELEGADEQLAYLAEMGMEAEDEMIAYTLRDLKEMPALLKVVKQAWRTGDNDKLEAVALRPLKQDFPGIYEVLVARRNHLWLPKIERMLETPDVELILVGALHLAGEDGLLRQLSARGWDVRNIQ